MELAVDLSRREFEYTGQWTGVRVEVTGEDVRNRPLSTVLAYTNVLQRRVSKLKPNTGSLANLPELQMLLSKKERGQQHMPFHGIMLSRSTTRPSCMTSSA